MQRGLDQAFDEYLVLLAQGGSRAATARLAARWTPKLLTFAARTLGATETAKDAVQETWEAALRGLRGLEDPARFRAWLYAIAARKCADVLRDKYRGRRIAEAVAASAEPPTPDPASVADTSLDVAAALKLLPADQRVAVSLFFGEDLSVAEIANITGAPAGTVKSRLFAARQTLRKHLGDVK
ncbi:MAG: RNA polymerase sigma factor [Hyphomonadaceae bacterium]